MMMMPMGCRLQSTAANGACEQSFPAFRADGRKQVASVRGRAVRTTRRVDGAVDGAAAPAAERDRVAHHHPCRGRPERPPERTPERPQGLVPSRRAAGGLP